jgi:hypothetical protein
MGNHSCVVFASHQELWVLGTAANARVSSSSGRGTATVTIYALDWIQFVEKLYSQTLTQPRCPVPWRMLCTRHNLSGYYIHSTAFFSPLPDLWIVSGGSFFYIRLFPVWTASSGRSVHIFRNPQAESRPPLFFWSRILRKRSK